MEHAISAKPQPACRPATLTLTPEFNMPQAINTNILSMNAQRNLNASQTSLATSVQRLSSGLRINSAKDDAAGLAIAERMRAQVRGMNVAIRNANDGVSLAQTAEGAIGQVSNMLQRMRELAVQSANATNSAGDRSNLNSEFQQLGSEITRTLSGTKFNGTAILAAGAGAQVFQVGANNGDTVTITTTNLSSHADITAVTGGDISSAANANTALTNIDTALTTVNTERATYGAVNARFDSIIATLEVSAENLAASRGRIVDTDFAQETANLSRTQILQQAGSAMVAQANRVPQQVLLLLQQA
jgi:flagellin